MTVQSRPVLRRLLNLLTAVSLLLCVAVVALWVRSLWCFDQLDRQRVDAQGQLRGVRGFWVLDLILAKQ